MPRPPYPKSGLCGTFLDTAAMYLMAVTSASGVLVCLKDLLAIMVRFRNPGAAYLTKQFGCIEVEVNYDGQRNSVPRVGENKVEKMPEFVSMVQHLQSLDLAAILL